MQSSEVIQGVFSGGNFTGLDWVIVIVYVSISLVIGIFANRFISGVSSYVVAGRDPRTAVFAAPDTATHPGFVTGR